MSEKKFKPTSCGSCKFSGYSTGVGIMFKCLKEDREIPGTSGTIEKWCPFLVGAK